MTLHFSSIVDIQSVFRILSEPSLFVQAHPLIFRMDPLTDGSYTVHEKIMLLGIVPYSFQYKAWIESDPVALKVKITAHAPGHTLIVLDIHLTPEGTGTAIREDVTVNSPLPIRSMMHSLLKAQHEKMFVRIDQMGF